MYTAEWETSSLPCTRLSYRSLKFDWLIVWFQHACQDGVINISHTFWTLVGLQRCGGTWQVNTTCAWHVLVNLSTLLHSEQQWNILQSEWQFLYCSLLAGAYQCATSAAPTRAGLETRWCDQKRSWDSNNKPSGPGTITCNIHDSHINSLSTSNHYQSEIGNFTQMELPFLNPQWYSSINGYRQGHNTDFTWPFRSFRYHRPFYPLEKTWWLVQGYWEGTQLVWIVSDWKMLEG